MDAAVRTPASAVGVPVSAAVHTFPKTCGPATTVRSAREFFANDHVHALLVVNGTVLVAVVERDDLDGAADDAPVAPLGRLGDRVAHPDDDLRATWDAMAGAGRRRVAVVDAGGLLTGLLCLKRSGRGFCSDDGVRARAEERALGDGTAEPGCATTP
ncbi:CBS domain-containing protein [Pseudonocardia nematodicida]|uniref:CBS domain-containing protein n=1 Tax=Pseudonocardia nematodicida TaxID=1206997 RepID=A0ABV1KDC0_9PSEU